MIAIIQRNDGANAIAEFNENSGQIAASLGGREYGKELFSYIKYTSDNYTHELLSSVLKNALQ